jgi:hypothetical protein
MATSNAPLPPYMVLNLKHVVYKDNQMGYMKKAVVKISNAYKTLKSQHKKNPETGFGYIYEPESNVTICGTRSEVTNYLTKIGKNGMIDSMITFDNFKDKESMSAGKFWSLIMDSIEYDEQEKMKVVNYLDGFPQLAAAMNKKLKLVDPTVEHKPVPRPKFFSLTEKIVYLLSKVPGGYLDVAKYAFEDPKKQGDPVKITGVTILKKKETKKESNRVLGYFYSSPANQVRVKLPLDKVQLVGQFTPKGKAKTRPGGVSQLALGALRAVIERLALEVQLGVASAGAIMQHMQIIMQAAQAFTPPVAGAGKISFAPAKGVFGAIGSISSPIPPALSPVPGAPKSPKPKVALVRRALKSPSSPVEMSPSSS